MYFMPFWNKVYKVLRKDEKKNTKLRSFEALEVFFFFFVWQEPVFTFCFTPEG